MWIVRRACQAYSEKKNTYLHLQGDFRVPFLQDLGGEIRIITSFIWIIHEFE